MVGLLVMVVLVGLGEKMAERFLPVYLVALGASTLVPGLLNGLDNLLSALYSFPGGWLSSRLGYKKALAVFNIVALFGYAIVILVPSWPAVIVGSVFFLSWTALSLPATMDLVAKVLPKNKRTMGVSLHSLMRRLPMALGPVCGGLLIDACGIATGVRLAFGAAFVLGLVSLFAQQWLINDRDSTGAATVPGLRAILSGMSKPLKNLLVSDILIRFAEQMPYAYIAIWAMLPDPDALSVIGAGIPAALPFLGALFATGVSGVEFGILTAIEMVTALLVYIPVAWLADRWRKKPLVAITFVNFTLFPVVLFFARGFPALVFAFFLRGLKEFGEPTRKALIMDLAPEGRKAATFGGYYLVRDVVVSLAAFGSAFLWQAGPAPLFFGAAFFGLLGTIWFIWRGSDRIPEVTA